MLALLLDGPYEGAKKTDGPYGGVKSKRSRRTRTTRTATSSLTTPRAGGLLRHLGACSLCCRCLDPTPKALQPGASSNNQDLINISRIIYSLAAISHLSFIISHFKS